MLPFFLRGNYSARIYAVWLATRKLECDLAIVCVSLWLGYETTHLLLIDGNDYLLPWSDDWCPFRWRILQVRKVEYDHVLQLQLLNRLRFLPLGLHDLRHDRSLLPWPIHGRLQRIVPKIRQRDLTRGVTWPYRRHESTLLQLCDCAAFGICHVLRL